MNDFGRSLNVLCDTGVEFVVVGGAAITAHGSAYVTADLDICYERSAANIVRLVTALRPHCPRLRGAPEGLPFIFDEVTVKQGLNFTLTTDMGDLDLLGEVGGIGQYPEVVTQSINLDLFGRMCKVLSLNGLIESKRHAGRRKDLMVLPELEALREMRRDNQSEKQRENKWGGST